MMNEADTRAKLIDPPLCARGWKEDHIKREETAGAVEMHEGKARRARRGRMDYTLRVKVTADSQPVAVALIEAKAENLPPDHGLEQGKVYGACKRVNVPFVFATNGHLFVMYDNFNCTTTKPRPMTEFPRPEELRAVYEKGMGFSLEAEAAKPLLTRYSGGEATRRYYQDAAIRAVFEKIARGENRALLALATGSGKTFIAVNLLRRIADAGQLRKALFICDRDELRNQGLGAFQNVFGADAADVSGRNPQKNARVLIATYQTLDIDSENSDANFLTSNYPENYFSHIVIIDWESRRFIPMSRLSSEQQVLCLGDIVVSTANSKALVGKSCVVSELPFSCTFGAFVTVLRLTSSDVDSTYLSHWFRSPDTLAYFFEVSANTTNISNLKVTDILAIEIPLSPLDEQRWIAGRLNEQLAAVEAARKAAEEQLEAAWELPSAYFRNAFLGITPLSANTQRDKAPKGWSWKKLTTIARLESGHTPSRYHAEWWGGLIPWIALPDIRAVDGKVAYETLEYTNEEGIANSSARILPAGTVCLSRTASVGFVTIMGREMATSQDFVNWVCGPELGPYFLMYLFLASRDYFRSISSGAIHKTVYMPTAKALEVCIPSIDEQRKIVGSLKEKLSSSEELIAGLESQLAEIERLPGSLLREAFNPEENAKE